MTHSIRVDTPCRGDHLPCRIINLIVTTHAILSLAHRHLTYKHVYGVVHFSKKMTSRFTSAYLSGTYESKKEEKNEELSYTSSSFTSLVFIFGIGLKET